MKIGLLVSEESDPSWQKMHEWIKYFGHDPIIIFDSEIERNNSLKLYMNNKGLSVSIVDDYCNIIDFEQIDIFFQRKWIGSVLNNHEKEKNDKSETEFINNELIALRDFILFELKKSNKIIGYCSKESSNKLIQLFFAMQCGLRIPNTLITNIDAIAREVFKSQKIITKAIDGVFLSNINGKYFTNYTSNISLDSLEKKFFITQFQSKINKYTELRIFYLLGTFYCMASLCNYFEDEVDIRILLAENKVEYYPFKLANNIKIKIRRLMNRLELDTASIDMIIDPKGHYYFIDLNPHGQFSMLSSTCYPFLEKDIVIKLINEQKKRKGNSFN